MVRERERESREQHIAGVDHMGSRDYNTSIASILKSKLENQVMYIPGCPACGKVFDEGIHAPRILVCGHSVCQICLEQHLILEPSEPSFTCLECQTVSQWHYPQIPPKNFAILGAFKTVAPYPESSHEKYYKLWKEVPSKYLIPILKLTTFRISDSVERKLQEIGNILGITSLILFYAPISCIHAFVSCFTAGLGFLVLSWSSIGGLGLGLGMLFLWWTRNLSISLYRFGRLILRFPVGTQKPELKKICCEKS